MARKPKAKPEAKAKPKPKADERTPEELAKLKAAEVPTFYASIFRIQGSGNDFNLIFQRSIPAQREDGSIDPTVALGQNVAVITVGPQSLKDLHILIGRQLKEQEEDFGPIKTPYMMRLDEQKP